MPQTLRALWEVHRDDENGAVSERDERRSEGLGEARSRLSESGQRSQDATHVRGHRRCRAVSIARTDRVDNLGVLRQRGAGPAGNQGESVLVAHHLRMHEIEHADRCHVASDGTDAAVERGVQIGVAQQLARVDHRTHLLLQVPKVDVILRGGSLRGPSGHKTLDSHANFGDLNGFFDRDLAHASSPIGLKLDEALRFEREESVSQDETARSILFSKVRFDQSLARRVNSTQNRIAKSVAYIILAGHGVPLIVEIVN